jgi:hypothetical protein
MNKVYLIIVLVLVLGGGYVFLKGKNTVQPVVTPAPTKGSGYTLGDVAKHSTDSDCWMAIENKVYDVSQFVSKHPGGKTILNGCGKDATTLFNERPTDNKGPHPAAATAELKNLYIGELVQ